MKESIKFIADVNELITLKEKIKTEIIFPTLHWEKRIKLYRQVASINERIKELL
jgi:hypothetical protein